MDVLVKGEEMEVSRSVPTVETSSHEKDRSQVILRAMFMGIRLMIIKLPKYIEVGELLIEKRSTGSQAQVIYQDGNRRVSVTRAAVCMEGKGMGMQTGYRST